MKPLMKPLMKPMMKPIALTASLILAAVSLYANPQSKPKEAAKPQPAASAPAGLTDSNATSNDSPLVRAAKAAHKSGIKSSTVITNETLIRTGGHFTTTASQQPIAPVKAAPGQTEEQWLAEKRKKEADATTAAAVAAKIEYEKRLAAERAAQLMEGDTPEGMLNDQPAQSSGQVQTMKPATPTTMETTSSPRPPL
jgi:hypothetical protein